MFLPMLRQNLARHLFPTFNRAINVVPKRLSHTDPTILKINTPRPSLLTLADLAPFESAQQYREAFDKDFAVNTDNPNKTHLKLVTKWDAPHHRGTHFTAEQDPTTGELKIREATRLEIYNASIRMLGGIAEYRCKSFIPIFQGLINLFEAKNYAELIDRLGTVPVIYCRSLDKAEAFDHAILYNKNQSYCSPWAWDYARQYVVPHFFNEDMTLKNSVQFRSQQFFSFSLGGREWAMVENAFRAFTLDALKKVPHYNPANAQKKLIDVFSHLSSVNIGYAAAWSGVRDVCYPKVVLFGGDDFGASLPKALFETVYADHPPEKPFGYYRKHGLVNNLVERLIFLGKDQLLSIADMPVNDNGHGFLQYIEALKRTVDAKLLSLTQSMLLPADRCKKELSHYNGSIQTWVERIAQEREKIHVPDMLKR
jgi:hypothetical protein